MAISKIENGKVLEELCFIEKSSAGSDPAFLVRTFEGSSTFSFGISEYVGTWSIL